MIEADFNKRFLTNTDETGRFIAKSLTTGKSYYVECIDDSPNRQLWGDINPSTKELEGVYGNKYKGGVTSKESLITEENGFDKIHTLKAGNSPTAYIDMLDRAYEKTLKK